MNRTHISVYISSNKVFCETNLFGLQNRQTNEIVGFIIEMEINRENIGIKCFD